MKKHIISVLQKVLQCKNIYKDLHISMNVVTVVCAAAERHFLSFYSKYDLVLMRQSDEGTSSDHDIISNICQ